MFVGFRRKQKNLSYSVCFIRVRLDLVIFFLVSLENCLGSGDILLFFQGIGKEQNVVDFHRESMDKVTFWGCLQKMIKKLRHCIFYKIRKHY